eukprot:6097312-Amphidinium_carterae.1
MLQTKYKWAAWHKQTATTNRQPSTAVDPIRLCLSTSNNTRKCNNQTFLHSECPTPARKCCQNSIQVGESCTQDPATKEDITWVEWGIQELSPQFSIER